MEYVREFLIVCRQVVLKFGNKFKQQYFRDFISTDKDAVGIVTDRMYRMVAGPEALHSVLSSLPYLKNVEGLWELNELLCPPMYVVDDSITEEEKASIIVAFRTLMSDNNKMYGWNNFIKYAENDLTLAPLLKKAMEKCGIPPDVPEHRQCAVNWIFDRMPFLERAGYCWRLKI